MSCFKITVNNFQYRVMWRPACLIRGVSQERGTLRKLCSSAFRPEQPEYTECPPAPACLQYVSAWCAISITAGKFCLDAIRAYILPQNQPGFESLITWNTETCCVLFLMRLNHAFLHYITRNSPLCSTMAFASWSPLPFHAHHHCWECNLARC